MYKNTIIPTLQVKCLQWKNIPMVCFLASSASSVTNRVLGKRIKILDLNRKQTKINFTSAPPLLPQSQKMRTSFSLSTLLNGGVYLCSSHRSPAQFVFFRFVVEVFDQSGNPLWEFSMPVWPGVRTQRLIPVQETKQGKETWPSVHRKTGCTRLTSLRTPHSFVCMQIQLSLLSDSPSNPNT